MGNILRHEKRRISFDNNFAYPPGMLLDELYHDENLNTTVATQSPEKTDHQILSQEEADYWTQRSLALEREHENINKVMQTEYENTLNYTRKLFESETDTLQINKIQSCRKWQSRMLKCYHENSRQPLNCSKFVEAFSHCVSSCQSQA